MLRTRSLAFCLLLSVGSIHAASDLATLTWNGAARDLVARRRVDPPAASRTYAMLSVAQDLSLALTHGLKPFMGRGNERSLVAGASYQVLTGLYPDEAKTLAKIPGSSNSVAYRFGAIIGRFVLISRENDGWNRQWTGSVPAPGPGVWFSSTGQPPLRPTWGQVRPWFMASGSQFRPAPPPAFGSPEFEAALAEVRWYSDNRTPEQAAIAAFWADGLGTATPPGHWNQIAADTIRAKRLGEREAARILSVMNRAVMDAGISVWDAKYTYWLARPSQVDTAITTPVGLPNFPAYTSGHSGFSGAAAGVLSYFFPKQAAQFEAMAEEAAISRVYGGIHYRFDSDAALEQGRAIAELAIMSLTAPIAHN